MMRNVHTRDLSLIAGGLFLLLFSACKKDHPTPPPPPVATPIATIGLFEVDSSIYKRIFIPVTKVGTVSAKYYGVFDTGSTGMTIDAAGLLPASMITNSGITVAGDSVTVNGITVTSTQAVVAYGDAQSTIREYGNLAYASVVIGASGNDVSTGRIPIFLYYKIVDSQTGQKAPPHSNDVFGVGPGVSFANSKIGSPLSYMKSSNGAVSGFKLATLGSAFSPVGTFVNNLLTIGLVPDDLSASSGFVMHSLNYFSQGGYSADIPATVTYNGHDVSATLLFDTGTPAISTIENSGAASNISQLPAGTIVTMTTTSGFKYSYTTSSTDKLTQVAKPSYTGDPRTIFSIDFFTDNEFLTNYRDHKIGLKNN